MTERDASEADVGEPAAGVEPSAVKAAQDVRVVLGRFRRFLRGVGAADDLNFSQSSVLARISKNGPASTSDLAAVEGVRPQSMAATVEALEARSLIERHPDPHDGRRRLLSLTPEGRAIAEGERHARQQWLSQALSERCTEDERQALITAMAVLERLMRA